MKRTLSVLTTAAVVASGAVILLGPAAPAATPEAGAKKQRTEFALLGAGYGTRLRGGDIPAGSDTTSYQAMGCTNVAGKANNNHVTEATLPGLGTASEVVTDVWSTESKKGKVSSNARSSIQRIVLGEPSLGTIELNAISTVTKAFHGKNGFGAKTRSRVGAILYTDAMGTQQELELPTPGEPLEIPGLATITVGKSVEKTTKSGARAEGDALVLDMVATGTRLRVAHVFSEIHDDVKHGLFKGRSFAVQGNAIDGNISLGRQPLSKMPCQGTEGEVVTKALASLDLGENGTVRGLSSRLLSDQTSKAALGYARGRVDAFELGDDQITADNIVGRVNVTRTAKGGLKRNINGSKLGEVTVQGEVVEFPPSDVIEIPGVVRLERNLVTKLTGGLEVTALRVTLLDGTGAVIDLGEAKLVIRDAGL